MADLANVLLLLDLSSRSDGGGGRRNGSFLVGTDDADGAGLEVVLGLAVAEGGLGDVVERVRRGRSEGSGRRKKREKGASANDRRVEEEDKERVERLTTKARKRSRESRYPS